MKNEFIYPIMKNLAFLILTIALLSCGERKPSVGMAEAKDLTPTQIDSVLSKFNFEYESPIILDSSDHILIPISTEIIETRSIYTKDGYSSGEYPRYWNILFYNRKSKETRLLVEEKTRISQIFIIPDEYKGKDKIFDQKILYQMGDVDFNRDEKLNSWDPEFLYASELDGTNLVQVSPENEDLQHFEVIPNSNQILIRTLRDKNGDLAFNSEDEPIWYIAELEGSGWKTEEIIDSDGRKKIEKLYFDQWLKKSKKE